MKKRIYHKYPKEEIAALPVAAFNGRIVVIISEGETEKAVDYLLNQPILGIDTETRPTFHRGESRKVALLQVSTLDICFLFRLNMTGMTPSIIRLLENDSIPMVGLSLHDDLHSLRQRCPFIPGWFIDLQDMVGSLGIEDRSLQKLFANLMGMKISKRQQLSNWEADVLSEKQKLYASTDAWACLILYDEILRLQESGNFDFIEILQTSEQP